MQDTLKLYVSQLHNHITIIIKNSVTNEYNYECL